MSKKKIYLYYGTEENCFECEKHEITNPEAEAKQFLTDDYVQADVADYNVYGMLCEFNKKGYGTLRLTNGQGYDIFLGIAEKGKCRPVYNELRSLRSECIAMNF